MTLLDIVEHGLHYHPGISAALHPRDDHIRRFDRLPFDRHVWRLGSFGMAATQKVASCFPIPEAEALFTLIAPSGHEPRSVAERRKHGWPEPLKMHGNIMQKSDLLS